MSNRGRRSTFRSGAHPCENAVSLLVLYIPTEGDARVTSVAATHHTINLGITIPKLNRLIDGALNMRTMHTETASYAVFTPAQIAGYNISEAIYEETGLQRRGPVVVFQRSRQNRLFVNMRPYGDETRREIFQALATFFGSLDD